MRFPGIPLLGMLVLLNGAPCRADAVLDWTALMLDAIRDDDSAPTLSSRNLAILHTAMYDAVNSIERTRQPYQFNPDPPEDAIPEAAATGAAYEVVQGLYPALGPLADDLYNSYVTNAPQTAALTNSLAFGSDLGLLALESRIADGSATTVPYVPSDDPGQWRRTPKFFRPPVDPQWRYVKPFCLPDLEPFVPPGPPDLTSDQYAADFNQVKAIGGTNSVTRTAEQSQIATFWSDFSYTAMPPGHWHEIAAVIAANRTNTLADNALMFALLSLAQADAAIVCWETKYRYNFWRPVTAIQNAEAAGNSATVADTNWFHFLNAPSFPEYTSGHSTFSKASATVLAAFYGTDAISFTVGCDSLPGVYRSFASLSACADEVGMSRIYGGIHFMSANVDGKACGASVANYILGHFLLPNSNRPQLAAVGLVNGQMRLALQGVAGTLCSVEATSDFAVWTPISTNTLAMGSIVIADPEAKGPAQRYYRAVAW